MGSSSHLCVLFLFTVVMVGGARVNEKCVAHDDCYDGMTCQDDTCKRMVGEICNAEDECVLNSQCSPNDICLCPDHFLALYDNATCAKPVDVECSRNSECVPRAECRETVGSGVKRNLCQCTGTYDWDAHDLSCHNTAQRVGISFLVLVASTIVTSILK